MNVDLSGTTARVSGEVNEIAEAISVALVHNGARLDSAALTGIHLISLPLLPGRGCAIAPLLDELEQVARAMAARGGGRIVVIASAIAVMPMRRHPEFSRQVAGVVAAVRSLAMVHAPDVIINAVAVGAIGEPLVSGDSAMLSHVPVGRPGQIAEVVGTALFLLDPRNSYTTGQVLVVDGGWSVGYGRNF